MVFSNCLSVWDAGDVFFFLEGGGVVFFLLDFVCFLGLEVFLVCSVFFDELVVVWVDVFLLVLIFVIDWILWIFLLKEYAKLVYL